jgi:hypothetical protein
MYCQQQFSALCMDWTTQMYCQQQFCTLCMDYVRHDGWPQAETWDTRWFVLLTERRLVISYQRFEMSVTTILRCVTPKKSEYLIYICGGSLKSRRPKLVTNNVLKKWRKVLYSLEAHRDDIFVITTNKQCSCWHCRGWRCVVLPSALTRNPTASL